jgi:hypothetical protein
MGPINADFLLFSFELALAPKWDNPGLDTPKLHQSRVNQASLVRAFQNPEMSTVSVEGIDPLINWKQGIATILTLPLAISPVKSSLQLLLDFCKEKKFDRSWVLPSPVGISFYPLMDHQVR